LRACSTPVPPPKVYDILTQVKPARYGLWKEWRLSLTSKVKVVKNVVMTQSPIAEAKKRLCELVDLAEAGETIVILRHGRPVARLMPMPVSSQPWRVEKPDDPRAYKGLNIDEPVLEAI
jgi:prevent-host-death family protein